MPRITFPHAVIHEPVADTNARTSPSDEGGGHIAPVSVTPPEAFGFVARPAGATSRARLSYSQTRSLQTPSPRMFDARTPSPPTRSPRERSPHTLAPSQARPDGRGEPVLENRGLDELLAEIADEYDLLDATHPSRGTGNDAVPHAGTGVTQSDPPGSLANTSAASSSQGLLRRISLDEVMADERVVFTPGGEIDLGHLRPSFLFHGERLPFDRLTTSAAAHCNESRAFVKEQVASVLERSGYRIENRGASSIAPLRVTNPSSGKSFTILPRLTSNFRPNISGRRYVMDPRVDMIAIVKFRHSDRRTLESLYLVRSAGRLAA